MLFYSTPANIVKLKLANVSQWANSGNTVTQGEHTYAVYNASSAAAAQLLIDQHMVLANHG